jgi:hypothetical protein
MAEPTIRLRGFAFDETDEAINSPAERLAALGSDYPVTAGTPPGAGNELDFGIIDISGGAANSVVQNIRFDITLDQGNTLIEDLKLFLLVADNGFSATTVFFTDGGLHSSLEDPNTNTSLYVFEADDTDYSGSPGWLAVPATEPGSLNLYAPDDSTSLTLTGDAANDTIMWANYLAVGGGEVTGTYVADSSGKEFRYSITYSYS